MKVFVFVLAVAAVALGDPVRVVEMPSLDPVRVVELPSLDPVRVVELPSVDPVRVVDQPFVEQPAAEPVKVVEHAVELLPPLEAYGPEAESPSILGYIVDVSFPLAQARKELEEAYFAQTERIAGGAPAVVGQYPWQAGLLSEIAGLNGNGVCGASLVSSNRLITAAHCWFDGINQAWRLTVILGSVFLFGQDGTRVQTTSVVMHPEWSPAIIRNDVAVINLASPVTFSAAISPINLPSGSDVSEDFAGSSGVISGFGLTGDSGSAASISVAQFLSHATVQVITNSVCFWSFPFIVHESNVCISGEGGRSTCRGDSGGPLVVWRNNIPVLAGITSFGSAQGCTIGRPAAFARVTSFLDFFRQHI